MSGGPRRRHRRPSSTWRTWIATSRRTTPLCGSGGDREPPRAWAWARARVLDGHLRSVRARRQARCLRARHACGGHLCRRKLHCRVPLHLFMIWFYALYIHPTTHLLRDTPDTLHQRVSHNITTHVLLDILSKNTSRSSLSRLPPRCEILTPYTISDCNTLFSLHCNFQIYPQAALQKKAYEMALEFIIVEYKICSPKSRTRNSNVSCVSRACPVADGYTKSLYVIRDKRKQISFAFLHETNVEAWLQGLMNFKVSRRHRVEFYCSGTSGLHVVPRSDGATWKTLILTRYCTSIRASNKIMNHSKMSQNWRGQDKYWFLLKT